MEHEYKSGFEVVTARERIDRQQEICETIRTLREELLNVVDSSVVNRLDKLQELVQTAYERRDCIYWHKSPKDGDK